MERQLLENGVVLVNGKVFKKKQSWRKVWKFISWIHVKNDPGFLKGSWLDCSFLLRHWTAWWLNFTTFLRDLLPFFLGRLNCLVWMLLWRVEILMGNMGCPELNWATPLWWPWRRHRFVPSLYRLNISRIFLYVARPEGDASNKWSSKIVRSLSTLLVISTWIGDRFI